MSWPDRPAQYWLRCTTCDVRFLSRSAESLHHNGPECHVEVDE